MFELICLTGLIISGVVLNQINMPYPVIIPATILLAVPISVGLGIIYDLYRKVFDK